MRIEPKWYNAIAVLGSFKERSALLGKISQELLGHSSLKTTMDRYVHVTDDSKEKAVQQFEKLIREVQRYQNSSNAYKIKFLCHSHNLLQMHPSGAIITAS